LFPPNSKYQIQIKAVFIGKTSKTALLAKYTYALAVILFGPGGLLMSKMSMFQKAGMREGRLPLPPPF
jgi:hypothetical protein